MESTRDKVRAEAEAAATSARPNHRGPLSHDGAGVRASHGAQRHSCVYAVSRATWFHSAQKPHRHHERGDSHPQTLCDGTAHAAVSDSLPRTSAAARARQAPRDHRTRGDNLPCSPRERARTPAGARPRARPTSASNAAMRSVNAVRTHAARRHTARTRTACPFQAT